MSGSTKTYNKNIDKFFKLIALGFVLVGVVVRIAVFLQNRDFFIDEANIARNIFERNFLQLAQPLSYEQYAPPVFLWIMEVSSGFFGFSEMAFRLYPLVAGIGSLVMMYLVLKQLTSIRSLWYPIALMAVSYMMIRYSTEVKQYISDVFIVLILVFLALKTDLYETTKKKFLITWAVAGTLAIWSCMPSVFVLAGIGCYYFFDALQRKANYKAKLVVGLSVFWLLQFVLYYFLILKPQINSDYLQNFHRPYFLFAKPDDMKELRHNWLLVKEHIKETVGFYYWSTNFNLLLLVIGSVWFFVKDRAKSLIFLVPIVITLIAAAAKQYSLIPRVSLFLMPFWLILICYGMEQFIRLRWKVASVIVFGFCCVAIYYMSMVRSMLTTPVEIEHITKSMYLLNKQPGIFAKHVYVDNSAKPAFIYYTQIHPAHSKWAKLRDANLLNWDFNYNTIGDKPVDTAAILFSGIAPKVIATRSLLHDFNVFKQETVPVNETGAHLIIYIR